MPPTTPPRKAASLPVITGLVRIDVTPPDQRLLDLLTELSDLWSGAEVYVQVGNLRPLDIDYRTVDLIAKPIVDQSLSVRFEGSRGAVACWVREVRQAVADRLVAIS